MPVMPVDRIGKFWSRRLAQHCSQGTALYVVVLMSQNTGILEVFKGGKPCPRHNTPDPCHWWE
jgi:hypothetical protein